MSDGAAIAIHIRNRNTIIGCARRQEPMVVCVKRAQVTRDSHRATPYPLDAGCVVGAPVDLDYDGFWLMGFSFATRIEYCDVVRAWARQIAPNPCPVCAAVSPPQTTEKST